MPVRPIYGARLVLRFVTASCVLVAGTASVSLDVSGVTPDDRLDSRPTLPPYLGGKPEDKQAHPYGPDVHVAPHTADGPGLHAAIAGTEASFTVRLAGENGADPEGEWNVDKKRFIYVWIANEDNIFIAAVENNGDGTLTASYESSFPGTYLVYIEDVDLHIRGDSGRGGQPIVGSPFSLTVSGEPALDVDALPVCGTEDEDVEASFWRHGSWVSSTIASAKHGVLRDGWVFQPKACVHDTFSYDDLMLLASVEEPTWLLAMGNSILRGVYLSLLDMVLARGQKDNLSSSAIQKCWGFVDVRIGNLRLTYQDLRLYTVRSVEDSTVCNDEKLVSGSTAAYVTSTRHFFENTVFQDDKPWPNVIWAPSNMVDSDEAPNVQINVIMDALPKGWTGELVMMDHMYGYGWGWNTANPTLASLRGVNPINQFSPPSNDSGVARMTRYHRQDPRTTFMSVFPIYQAKLFENEVSRVGQRCYGCSIHYHYISDTNASEAYDGSKMVHSAVTEMIANIMVTKAVGTKAALYEKVAGTPDIMTRRAEVANVFEICTDCPATLIPYHVKPEPELACKTVSYLPGNASLGTAWDEEVCPDWCLATDPVGQTRTKSGFVDVRACGVASVPP